MALILVTMKFIIFSLMLGSIAAFPTANSNGALEPILPRLTASTASECSNSSVSTKVTTLNSTLMRMDQQLDAFGAWPLPGEPTAGLKKSCTVVLTIGVPAGYRARANPKATIVLGYLNVPDEESMVTFTQEYFFTSKPDNIVSSDFLIAAQIQYLRFEDRFLT